MKRILVCPLDWGLGHAARCVPVIRELQRRNCEVWLAAANGPRALLAEEFPRMPCIDFPSYPVTYPKGGGMAAKMALSAPKLLAAIRKEHLLLQSLIRRHRFDAIISDNRYGLWTRRIPCVFITHQVRITCPPALKFLEPPLLRLNRHFLNRYDRCWIPDWEGADNLSGELSHCHPLPAHVRFIGPLSRFNGRDNGHAPEKPSLPTCDLAVILSGPEPQRTIFEKNILAQLAIFRRTGARAIVVRGIPHDAEVGSRHMDEGDFAQQIFNHLPAEKLRSLLLSAAVVLCRPGYSSLMDLAALGICPVVVPTPGQTEQEYLASYHQKKGNCLSLPQRGFNLAEALLLHRERGLSSKRFIPAVADDRFLAHAIGDLTSILK